MPPVLLGQQLASANALPPGSLAAVAVQDDGLRLLDWRTAHDWSGLEQHGFRVLELGGGWCTPGLAQRLLAVVASGPPPPPAQQTSPAAICYPWSWPAEGCGKRARAEPVQPGCSAGASNGSSDSLAPVSAASVVGGQRCARSGPKPENAGEEEEGDEEEISSASAKRRRRAGRQQQRQRQWEQRQAAVQPAQLLPHFSDREVELLREWMGTPQPGCSEDAAACSSVSVDPRGAAA